jgi:Fe-S-cluster containining protein
METCFSCTQCGQCCRDTKIPLTVGEAVDWLRRGHEVQLLCEASPWPAALDDEPRAQHFRRRSFAAMSGSVQTRVVVMLAANIVGACPNLQSDQRCGIYEVRPLVCRIYPAEINPFVRLNRDNKACPPEAWAKDAPLLQRGGVVIDEVIRRDIELSRAADVREADFKSRLCLALDVIDTGLVHESVVVYTPKKEVLLSALALATATAAGEEASTQWRFVSTEPASLAAITASGAIAVLPPAAGCGSFQHIGAKREAIFLAR